MDLINSVYQRLGANCSNNRWEFNLALMIRRIASESAVTHIRNSHDSYFRSNITCRTHSREREGLVINYTNTGQDHRRNVCVCVWPTFIFILFTIFISNMKLSRVLDVNIMLHPVRVKHLNFATKPLSLVATFLYFSGKLRSMGYRVLARGILHIYTVADRRGAQRYSFPVGGCGGSHGRLRHKEKILSQNIPAFDACLRGDVYEYFIHSRIESVPCLYLSFCAESRRDVIEIEFIFESRQKA